MDKHAHGGEEGLQERHCASGVRVCVCVCVCVCVTFREMMSLPQTLKSAIGMKESEETAGLASPKLTRQDETTRAIQVMATLILPPLSLSRHHASDMLLGKAKKVSLTL